MHRFAEEIAEQNVVMEDQVRMSHECQRRLVADFWWWALAWPGLLEVEEHDLQEVASAVEANWQTSLLVQRASLKPRLVVWTELLWHSWAV